MTLNLKTEIENINQGCGKEISHTIDRVVTLCGRGNNFVRLSKDKIETAYKFELCPSCKSKKQGLIQGAKMMIEDVLEIIDKWANDKRYGDFGWIHKLKIQELKEQLTEEGKE